MQHGLKHQIWSANDYMHALSEQRRFDCSMYSFVSLRFKVLCAPLQAVQPSKEIRREELEREFRANQQYLQNASHHRGSQPTASRVETLQLSQ